MKHHRLPLAPPFPLDLWLLEDEGGQENANRKDNLWSTVLGLGSFAKTALKWSAIR